MIYIDNNPALAQAASHWLTLDRIALDSEFMRVDTFYPILSLIQINDGSHIYLIDPITITDWQPLRDVFTCESVLKILHSPSEDFDAFNHNLGVLPRPIMDTQLAASMASLGGIMGYQKLVQLLLGVELEKGETRSDWMQRPLTDSQLHYASEDVNHLLLMASLLEEKLKALGRWEWLVEDCRSMVDDWIATQAYGYTHERVKKAWMLKPHQLNVLSELVKWREQRCKAVNKPRGHLIKDELLVDVATRLPQTVQQLGQFKGIRQATVRKEGQQIIDIIQACKEMPKEQWPERLDRPLTQNAGEWLKKIKMLMDKIATELNIPADLLARKKHLESMLRQGYPTGPFKAHESLQGWRETVVAEPLLQLLNKLAK